ncbi:MAG: NADH-quinone oxidoreductase subunit I [Candidatus Riflebacteria bacterium]|nr:NADH-quinone oxidoreductase subunit I [Candidatus Riflebacteria bacterium]
MEQTKNELSWGIRVYLLEIVKGLAATISRMLGNLLDRRRIPTICYPEERRPISIRLRAKHRLLVRPDGKPRCVACMLCATACPAECIYIDAAEEPDKTIEKYPKQFRIDLLRCVYCGYCQEACPCDAIRMDTGIYEITGYDRSAFFIEREALLAGKPMPGVPDVPLPKTLPGLRIGER